MITVGQQITWTSPHGDREVILRRTETVIQVVEQSTLSPEIEILPFPDTDAGEAEARAVACAKAEIIRYNQTGK